MNDDLDWTEALAGRPRDGLSAATATEARLLRDAMLRWPVHMSLAPPDDIEALLERARAEGLMTPRRGWCPGCLARWRRWFSWLSSPWGAAPSLALVMVLGVSVVLVRQTGRAPEGGPGIMRGAAASLNLKQSPDPARARDRLASRLVALQVAVHAYERLGRYGLDADLPSPLPAGVAILLRGERLSPAADGSLRVEFEKAGS